MYGRSGVLAAPLERIELSIDRIPDRWYNVIPDLPRAPDELIDGRTGEPLTQEYLERLLPRALAAQERSLERWISVPDEVAAAYRQWRPAPLYRAHALERELDTPAEIYFKYEGASPSGSHKLNSALAQAYYAKQEGVRRGSGARRSRWPVRSWGSRSWSTWSAPPTTTSPAGGT